MTDYQVLQDGSLNCLRCGAGMSKDDVSKGDLDRHLCDTTAPLLGAERDELRECLRLAWGSAPSAREC